MNYEEALAWLDGLAVFGIKPGLSRIERLLELLDMPQSHYRTIHVTGTNGKGSVSAMLAGILRRSDIHTGLFTSPHLVSYTERMQIDGQPISEKEFADCISAISVYVDKMIAEGSDSPTQFEVLTAAAFFYFAMKHVEYAVIEVGLGGLLDSTNVIQPEISVITNVTMEHADKCGGTLAGIAHHKAGIIKKNTPVVTAATGEVLDIIRETAEEKNSDIFVMGEEFSAGFVSFDGHLQHLTFSACMLGLNDEPYTLHMQGTHQVENSAVAFMTAKLLTNVDERITLDNIKQALAMVSWPGRFERVDYQDKTIILDGAHNPAGITVLRQSLDTYFPARQRVFLIGILHDKDIDNMVKILFQPDDVVVVTTPNSYRAEKPEILAQNANIHVKQIEAYAEPTVALQRALELTTEGKLLTVAGSLYLLGDIRNQLMQKMRGDS